MTHSDNGSPRASTLHDIRKTIVLDCPISKAWDAVSTAEGLTAWFMPNDLQAEVGHKFQLNAGPFGMSPCEVTEVEPPSRLSFKWGKDWTLTFELTALDGQTECTLIHGGWDAETLTEFGQPHTVIRGNMDQGWTGLIGKLGEYVRG